MTESLKEPFVHPANAVFSLMEDREFRFTVIRPGLEKDKIAVCRMSTGKHQLKGFRHLEKAPAVMIVPVLSDEANLSPELAKALLEAWFEDSAALRERVTAKLVELGYAVQVSPFDKDGNVSWRALGADHAAQQYDGVFIEGEDKNGVMLMSLLLGWFGSDDEDDGEEEAEGEEQAEGDNA
jgi:hypothetical protein